MANSQDTEKSRTEFEKFISSPPFEAYIARFPDDATKFAWPGSYKQLDVDLAWQSWQEATRQARAQGDAVDARRYRELRRGQKWSVIDGLVGTLRADELDTTIDTAIAADKEKSE